MPAFASRFAVLLTATLLAATASAETLRVAGTGGATPFMAYVAPAFAAASGIEMEVIQGLGSKGAIGAAADGVIELAVSARPLNAEESDRGLTAIPFARTALVFITSHPRPSSVKSAELIEIFSSTNPKWADGSPMNVILRTRFDGDTLLLEELFPGIQDAMEAARTRPEIPVAPTDQDNATLAEEIPGSFVQAGLSQIVTEKRDLRFVPIDGVEPSLETLESGTYPYEKQFHLVFAVDAKAQAVRLLDFLQSPEGEALLRATGNLPIAD